MRLLLTRPQREAERTALTLAARGHEGVIHPLFEIVSRLPEAAAEAEALVFTSAQALHHLPPQWLETYADRPVFAVGERTASVARAKGFAHVIAAEGDALRLAALIARHQPRRLLHPCGADIAADLGALLGPDFSVERRVVYAARPLADPPPLPLPLDGVLHFSPRAGRAFVAAYGHQVAAMAHYCLSQAVAAPLVAAGGPCQVAAEPSEADLLALLPP